MHEGKMKKEKENYVKYMNEHLNRRFMLAAVAAVAAVVAAATKDTFRRSIFSIDFLLVLALLSSVDS